MKTLIGQAARGSEEEDEEEEQELNIFLDSVWVSHLQRKKKQ